VFHTNPLDWDTLDDPTVSNAEIISVAHEIPHPLFDKDTYFADVMIVVLDRLSVFEPVCLANENTLSNLDIFLNVLGFGMSRIIYFFLINIDLLCSLHS